jgi:hypothetical protein
MKKYDAALQKCNKDHQGLHHFEWGGGSTPTRSKSRGAAALQLLSPAGR